MPDLPASESKIYGSWGAVKAFALIAFIAVVCYKLLVTPFQLVVDFSALLSLLLALFSVGLAALFYFKTTETSNMFYDNSYKFTKDIADLLVRIESGFGERLRHLDEGYASMRSYLETLPSRGSLQETKQELKKEEEELSRKVEERDKMIEELATRAKLQERERLSFLSSLRDKEEELAKSQQELQFLRSAVRRGERQGANRGSGIDFEHRMAGFARINLVDKIGREYLTEAAPDMIARRFERIAGELPDGFLSDMRNAGNVGKDNRLTESGIEFLREIAKGRQ